MESQKRHPQLLSCEFFPPHDDSGAERLRQVRRRLADALDLEFFSVTYGAGGTTRERTLDAVLDIQRSDAVAAVPHLTCVASNRAELRALLAIYLEQGITRVLALRGDRPPGAGPSLRGELRYASELVAFIRAEFDQRFHIEVAAYPEFHPDAATPGQDLAYFKRKVDAGADSAITQYFYSAEAYFRFIDACEKLAISLPIIPGIMPITNYKQLARFSDQCGAEIPRWLRRRLDEFGDDRDGLRAYGLDVVSELCRRLLEQGAPGLHFYSMNQAEATLDICRNLGLTRAQPRAR